MISLVDTVEMIGDSLTEIDKRLARMTPSDPDAMRLTALRNQLDSQQRVLVQQVFDDNSAQFQSAAQALQSVNAGLSDSIEKLQDVAMVIGKVSVLLSSVTHLVATVAQLV